MSTNRECMVVELEPNRWYAFLGDDSINSCDSDEEYDSWFSSHDTEWVAVAGPASSEDAAYELIAERYGNPGANMALPYATNAGARDKWQKLAKELAPTKPKRRSIYGRR